MVLKAPVRIDDCEMLARVKPAVKSGCASLLELLPKVDLRISVEPLAEMLRVGDDTAVAQQAGARAPPPQGRNRRAQQRGVSGDLPCPPSPSLARLLVRTRKHSRAVARYLG